MTAFTAWNHPTLQPFHKRIPRNEWIFRQGKTGETMFLLLEGEVHLVAEPPSSDRAARPAIVGALYAVTFFGEQALMNPAPYKRAFSVRAGSDVRLVELGQYELGAIKRTSPDLLAELLEGIFHVAAERLRRANQLVRLLRSSDNGERLVRLLLYFCETASRPVGRGKEMLLTGESVRYYLDVDEATLRTALADLQKRGLLKPRVGDYWLVPDEAALRAAAPSLAESWSVQGV